MPPKQESNGWLDEKRHGRGRVFPQMVRESEPNVGKVTPTSTAEAEMQTALREGKKKKKRTKGMHRLLEDKGVHRIR